MVRLALLLHSKKLLGLNLLPCFLRGVYMFSPCLGSVWALWFPMMLFHIRRPMRCALKSILFCCLCYTEKVSPLRQAKRNTSTSQGGLVCAVVNLVAWCEVHSYNQQECRITGSGHILYTGKKIVYYRQRTAGSSTQILGPSHNRAVSSVHATSYVKGLQSKDMHGLG